MAERDYRIEEQDDGWRLLLLRGGEVVSAELYELHDEALAIGTDWICGDDDDDAEGVAWWNRLDERDRRVWLDYAQSDRPVDAWRAFQRGGR